MSSFWDDLLKIANPNRTLRTGTTKMFETSLAKSELERHSIRFRIARFANTLVETGQLAPEILGWSNTKVKEYYHEFRDAVIVNNNEIVKLIFD